VAMALVTATVVLVPAIGHGIFLLELSPRRLLGGLTMGAVGIILVEAAHRLSDRRSRSAESPAGTGHRRDTPPESRHHD